MRFIGRTQTVFDWSRDACEPVDIPDQAARAFRDWRGKVHLFASHYVTRKFSGKNLNHVRHSCRVVMRSGYDSRPAQFNDREWLSATYTPDGRTIYALLHTEYQGSTHPGRCPSSSYERCWYNAITLARSANGGRTFTRVRSPRQLVAAVPYRYRPDSGPYGLFQPSNIVRKGGYYYALLQASRYELQQQGSCLIRTRHLGEARSWRAWDGSGFNVRFINPYSPRLKNPASHICTPISLQNISVLTQSLTYNTYLRKYLLVGTSVKAPAPGRQVVQGIYYSTSSDLINWSPRRRLVKVVLPPLYKCGDGRPIAYPSLLDPKSSSRNFGTTGRRPYLYFTRFNYRRCRQTLDRDLLRRRVELSG